jgi:hypothetical protein
VRLEDLADVHARGHAERVENDLDRACRPAGTAYPLRHDARDDALVAVASRPSCRRPKLALHGDVDLHHLDHARRQLVALLQLGDLLVGDLFEHLDLPDRHLLDLVDLLVQARVACP